MIINLHQALEMQPETNFELIFFNLLLKYQAFRYFLESISKIQWLNPPDILKSQEPR